MPPNGRSSDRSRPDVLIIGDPEWLPERVAPGTAIVVVAENTGLSARLSRTGAQGWAIVPPDVSAELLRAAMTAATRGMVMLPTTETAAGGNLASRGEHGDTDEDEGTYDEALTSREREVLEGIASGLTNREIAERLGISDHTVKFHVSTIYGKLGASTRTAAVRRAVHRGLVTL